MPAPSWRLRDPGPGAARDVAVRPRLRVTYPQAAADAAVRGIGCVQLLHYQVADALQPVLQRWEPAPVPVHRVHAARGQMPLKMRRFLDAAAPWLRQVLAQIAAGALTGGAGTA